MVVLFNLFYHTSSFIVSITKPNFTTGLAPQIMLLHSLPAFYWNHMTVSHLSAIPNLLPSKTDVDFFFFFLNLYLLFCFICQIGTIVEL